MKRRLLQLLSYNLQLVCCLLFALGLLFASCRGRGGDPDCLVRADSLTVHDPKAAVVLLDSMRPLMADQSGQVRAYYDLLCVKAADRAYIPHTSDSLILQVIDYYEHYPETDRLAWAYCYGGRVYRDLHDAPRAIRYFQRSLDALPPSGNDELRARVLSQMGYIYFSQQLYEEAIEVKHEVLLLDSVASRTERIITGYKDMAQCYLALGEIDNAVSHVNYALQLAAKGVYPQRMAELRLLNARIEMEREHYVEALKLLQTNLADSLLLQRTPHLTAAIRAAQGVGGLEEKVSEYSQEILHSPANAHARYAAARAMMDVCKKKHQTLALRKYQELCVALLDTIAQEEKRVEVSQVSALYNYQLREKENQLLQIQMGRSRLLWMTIVVLMVCVVLLLWQHERKRKLEVLLQRERILSLELELEQNRSQAPATNTKTSSADSLYELIDERIRTHSHLTEQDWEQINDYFEKSCPTFRKRLCKLYDFSKIEWQITQLTRLNVRNVNISVLVCKHPSAISKSKQRLCHKALCCEGKAETWDEFVRSL